MRTSPLTVAVALAVSALWPSIARAQTAAVEAPAYPPPSARWGVAALGLGTTAFFYGLAAGASYIYPDAPGMRDLRTPVVGPWLAISHGACEPNDPDCSTLLVIARSAIEVLDGAAQAGGLVVMLEGLFMPTQERMAAPAAPPSSPTKTPPSEPGGSDKNLFYVPMPITVGSRGIGIGVIGRF
jgi:hypothetical protein